MPRAVQAFIDALVMLTALIAGGWATFGMLSVFARHTNIAKFWRSFAVAVFCAATFAFTTGPDLRLSLPLALLATTVLAILAIYFVCAVTLVQAACLAPLIIILLGACALGASILADKVMPGRWTFAQQYAMAKEYHERDLGGPEVDLGAKAKDTLALFIDALAQLTKPGEAALLDRDVAVGLAELRARRMLATNKEEVAANRLAYEQLKREMFGGAESTNGITTADIRKALEQLESNRPPPGPDEPVPDLDAAVAALWANLSSPEGRETFLILGHTLSDVRKEMDAMKSNAVLAELAAERPNPLGTSGMALAVGFMGELGAPTSGVGALGAMMPMGTQALATAMTGGTNLVGAVAPPTAGITSLVARVVGKQIEYVRPPEELRVSSVVSRADGTGMAVCNGKVVPVGGFVTVQTAHGMMDLKLEAIETNIPRWSLVHEVGDEEAIPMGRH